MKAKIFLAIGLVFLLMVSGCFKPRVLVPTKPERQAPAKPRLPETEKKLPEKGLPSGKLNYSKQLPPGELSLRKITDPAEIPDFTEACSDLSELEAAVNNSLNYLGKPSSRLFYPTNEISHSQAVDSLKAFAGLIASGDSAEELNARIREQFDVYTSVGCDDQGTVLFTGYYTPIFEGSTEPGGRFKYPLYGQPEDLVKNAAGVTLGRRSGGGVTPYPSRAEIESSEMFKGREIMWLADPFEVYIVHVQGSARILQPDGSLIGIGYTANNGHEYQSIARKMVDDGKIRKDQLNQASMIAYFKAHPDEVADYTRLNPRFVFFRITDGTPRGSLNEPVIPLRSIATDKAIYPRGGLTFISTTLPRAVGDKVTQEPYSGFALDQDTGGAIRAPGRCDVYMGVGEAAGKLAGQTYREGRLYYLILKPEYQSSGRKDQPTVE